MHIYLHEEIARKLREAREVRGLSQKDLSKLSGVPQSHISKIESGAVDLRVSSLAELSRALEMELMLVPMRALPAINSIISTIKRSSDSAVAESNPEQEIRNKYARPAYSLAD